MEKAGSDSRPASHGRCSERSGEHMAGAAARLVLTAVAGVACSSETSSDMRVGRSVPEPCRFFVSLAARLRFSWTESGLNLVPAAMRPSSCRFLWICHEAVVADAHCGKTVSCKTKQKKLPRSLAAPASRHKAPQSGLWLLLRHPVGTLKSRGLWSRGQHGLHKIRRGTVDGSWLVYFW